LEDHPVIAPTNTCDTSVANDSLHEAFLAMLPKIQTHARIHFQHIRCSETKADKIAEAVALAWKRFLRLRERGKDIATFRTVLSSESRWL